MSKCFLKGEILLPKANIDYSKWAVVACDQFTSKPEYWQQLTTLVGAAPSALNLILPECYLETDCEKQKTDAVFCNMSAYINSNIFNAYSGYLLLKRSTTYGNTRSGLVCQIDLEAYDFDPSKKAIIRATEGTVLQRIPARVKIREKCVLELPHIMILIDDPTDSVMKAAKGSQKTNVYDFELNMRGGHLVGDLITDEMAIEDALNALYLNSDKRYGEKLLMAVGDGNHSLAAAKQTYLNALKSGKDTSLLRYALVEIVNIYDSGLKFEPIHRAIFNVNTVDFMYKLNAAAKQLLAGLPSCQTTVYAAGVKHTLDLPVGAIDGVAFIQQFLDSYVSAYGGRIDYIHGDEQLLEHGKKQRAVTIQLKAMDKSELFNYIVKSGVLPRKTFSMGEAEEKRYYLEARKIRN